MLGQHHLRVEWQVGIRDYDPWSHSVSNPPCRAMAGIMLVNVYLQRGRQSEAELRRFPAQPSALAELERRNKLEE